MSCTVDPCDCRQLDLMRPCEMRGADIPPDSAFGHQRSKITPPSRPPPSDTLTQELRVILQSSEQLCLPRELVGDLPAMVDEEASHEVIIIGSDQRNTA